MRLELLGEIRHVVSFDAYAWLMTDPRTTVGVAPLADVPCLHELPRAIALKYLTEVNRWTSLAERETPVGLLRRETGDDPQRSPMWRDLQSAYAVVDVASIVFTDRFGCWGFLDLWRLDPAPTFDESDAAFLASVAAPIATALRTSQSATFAAPPSGARGGLGPMVLVLDGDLHVESQTEATAEWLEVLLPASVGVQPIPAAAYNVAAQLLASERGIDDHPPSARVHLADGLWVTLRAARLGPSSIAVTIEETTPSDRLEMFCLSFGLSSREAELLGHLATGGDTGDVAARMFVSAHTVQDHLKSIFAKTSAHNRRSLLSRAFGTR
jgi:DNA-binding CsgD family transcriptional regulator